MWFYLLWGLGLATAAIHIFVTGMPSHTNEIYTIILLHQFVVTFGLVGLLGVYVNIIYANEWSKKLGWPGGPFQVKYGFCQLCLGVMGVMAIWYRGPFWVAVLVNMYMYGLSGFWTHTGEMIRLKKADPIHIGNLIMDILYQLFITLMSIWAGGIWS
jgi:hypothetical protein